MRYCVGSSAEGSVTAVGVRRFAILSVGHLTWVLSVSVLGGGSERRICRSEFLASEILRLDVLLLVLLLVWCWIFHVPLARSCIAPEIAVHSLCCSQYCDGFSR